MCLPCSMLPQWPKPEGCWPQVRTGSGTLPAAALRPTRAPGQAAQVRHAALMLAVRASCTAAMGAPEGLPAPAVVCLAPVERLTRGDVCASRAGLRTQPRRIQYRLRERASVARQLGAAPWRCCLSLSLLVMPAAWPCCRDAGISSDSCAVCERRSAQTWTLPASGSSTTPSKPPRCVRPPAVSACSSAPAPRAPCAP